MGRRYETLSELFDYSARVAAAVGAMMCVLMRVRDAHALARPAAGGQLAQAGSGEARGEDHGTRAQGRRATTPSRAGIRRGAPLPGRIGRS